MKAVYIPSLTGLRFVAVAAVVISHSIAMMVKYDDMPALVLAVSQIFREGMTLFFVLSGFVIFLNYSASIRSPGGLRNFFVARFARLYPLYAIGVGYDLAMKWGYNQFPIHRIAALPLYATMTQSWVFWQLDGDPLIYQFGLVPQVSWSISTEFAFYLAFPFLCVAIARLGSVRHRLALGALYSVAAIIAVTVLYAKRGAIDRFGISEFGPPTIPDQDSFFRWLAYFSPYVRVLEFALGCLCASIYMKLHDNPPSPAEQRFGARLTYLALAAIAAVHYGMYSTGGPHFVRMTFDALACNFSSAPFLAVLIFCCARYQNSFASLMSRNWIVLCGEASYSAYLLHFIVINAFRYETPKITAWHIEVAVLIQVIVVFASVIGLSLVSWICIEIPCRKALRRWLTRDATREPAEAFATRLA